MQKVGMRMYFGELLESKNVLYVSGYVNDYSIVKLKCLECGCEWEMNIHNLKQKIKGNRGNGTDYIPCPQCRRWRRLVDLVIAKGRRKQDEFVESFGKWLKRNTIKAKKDYERHCLNCGEYYVTTNERKVYCSDRCKERAKSRRKDIQRQHISKHRASDTYLKRWHRYLEQCETCSQNMQHKERQQANRPLIKLSPGGLELKGKGKERGDRDSLILAVFTHKGVEYE